YDNEILRNVNALIETGNLRMLPAVEQLGSKMDSFAFESTAFGAWSLIDNKAVVLSAARGTLRAYLVEQEDVRMQDFPKYLFCTLRAMVRLVFLGGIVVYGPANLASAQISPDLPNPTNALNPLTTTLSI